MAETRTGPLPGYRPAASPRNGRPPEVAYRFRKTAGWDPFKGVHRDLAEVIPQVPEARRAPGGRGARLAAYAEARDAGFTRLEAAEYAGIARATAARYEREYKAGGTS